MKRIILILTVAFAVLAIPGVASARAQILTWHQARVYASWEESNLPVPGDMTGGTINWCNRWTNWRVDCGIEADGKKTTRSWDPCKRFDSNYNCVGGWDYDTESTSCMQTVDVKKNSRTGYIWTVRESDLSCG
jgi:hypothetical protein